MRHTAKSLRRTLEQFFTLIKTYVASGATGIARIIFNELSGLAASSTLRRVHKTLQQVTVGAARGRSSTSGHADLGSPLAPSPRRAAAAGAEVRGLVQAEAAFPTGARPEILGMSGVVLLVVSFATIPLITIKIAQRGILVLVQASNDVVTFIWKCAVS